MMAIPRLLLRTVLICTVVMASGCTGGRQDDVFLPSDKLLQRPFGKADETLFVHPPKVFYPEIWVDCLCGNLSKEGIHADLEAIHDAGFSGVQLFFGNRGGAWPGVEQISCLSPEWEDFVVYAAEEAHRLGLRFTLQNCPGWAMAGGPWITPDKAMRHLVWSKTLAHAGDEVTLPLPEGSSEDWRDYQDLMVLAFPAPLGERAGELQYRVEPGLIGNLGITDAGNPHVFNIVTESDEPVRTAEFSSVQFANHWFCYDPGIHGKLEAVYPDGSTQVMFDTDWPQSNWQDDRPLSLACREVSPTRNYRLTLANTHANASITSFRLFSGARKNGWESEAGWCLRSILRNDDGVVQDPGCWVDGVLDLSAEMDSTGHLKTSLPEGEWVIVRIGHVNTGKKNAPAPPEATGFECNKFDTKGADSHFAGYIGKLADGKLHGLLDGMLLDSWECETQTWTADMEEEFARVAGYDLRPWMPALMGYVVKDPETTARFLRDWRATVNDLVVNKFYGRMAELGHQKGLTVTYETAGGDVFPSDILEYFKYADIPMCEFWVHDPEIFVGTLNFKPIKPTVSAGRLYGKPRIAAEAFTSMQQTWDEQLSILKETANKNCIEGASYLIYQAYTHNPSPDRLVPGSSFGDGIGTPFLRSQTWWRYMQDFNDCMARTSFLLERGKPVSDILWYLGDEIDHKPDQEAPFVPGYKYDYCNPDILLNRLEVRGGRIVTPEGLSYRLLWLPESHRFLPETLEKMVEMVKAGAVIVGDRPEGLATLKDPESSRQRFDTAVGTLWSKSGDKDARSVGKGQVISGMSLEEALKLLHIEPDLMAEGLMWSHRQVKGADWYFVSAPKGGNFDGDITLRATGSVSVWNPVDGKMEHIASEMTGGRTKIHLSLARTETRFIVVRNTNAGTATSSSTVRDTKAGTADAAGTEARCADYCTGDLEKVPVDTPWTLTFPEGWGLDSPVNLKELKPLRDLPIPDEAKAFSGTVTYHTVFNIESTSEKDRCQLDLGRVEQIAMVTLNGHRLRPLWTWPYKIDVTGLIREGTNTLTIETTNTWYNRLVYDSNQPEEMRKTWTTNYPPPGSPLHDSGLIGPVVLCVRH